MSEQSKEDVLRSVADLVKAVADESELARHEASKAKEHADRCETIAKAAKSDADAARHNEARAVRELSEVRDHNSSLQAAIRAEREAKDAVIVENRGLKQRVKDLVAGMKAEKIVADSDPE